MAKLHAVTFGEPKFILEIIDVMQSAVVGSLRSNRSSFFYHGNDVDPPVLYPQESGLKFHIFHPEKKRLMRVNNPSIATRGLSGLSSWQVDPEKKTYKMRHATKPSKPEQNTSLWATLMFTRP